MTTEQVRHIIEDGTFPDGSEEATLAETHISWVILSENFAFKIKKPLLYPFLDFSSLDKRKFYCEREVELNSRLTQDMYLDVLPIRKLEGKITIDGQEGEIIDYAVKMRRLDTRRQMNILLMEGEVGAEDMRKIADQLAVFHAGAEVIKRELDLKSMQEDFADISKVKPFLAENLGESEASLLSEAVRYSNHFLQAHEFRLQERIEMGFTIDGHGDLHSKNIFLLDEEAGGQPVIFDCIEFSDHFRQVDILNELAFFCMDLDFYDRPDLEAIFLEAYQARRPVLLNEVDWQIFRYYKLYRANVRVKINALKSMQSEDYLERRRRSGLVKEYFRLFEGYLAKARAPRK